MNWWFNSFLAMFVATACIFLLQSLAYFRSGRTTAYAWGFTILSAVLTTLSIVATVLLRTERIVLSPEFDIVMISAGLAQSTVRIVLFVGATSVGLGWALARTHMTHNMSWLSVLGLMLGYGIGGLSAARLLPLNSGEQSTHQIFVYDLWWPPLLVWCVIAICDSGYILLHGRSRLTRLWLSSLAVATLSVVGLYQPVLTDPLARPLWIGLLYLTLPINMALSIWLCFDYVKLSSPASRRLELHTFILLVPGAMGIVLAYWLWGLTHNVNPGDRASFVTLARWSLLPGWVTLAFLIARQLSLLNTQPKLDLQVVSTLSKAAGYGLIVLLITMAWLVGVFFATNVVLPVMLAALAWTWLLFGGAVTRTSTVSVLGIQGTRVARLLRRQWQSGGMAQQAGGTPSVDLGSQNTPQPFRSVLKICFGVVLTVILLIAAIETFNFGKTIIQPIPTRGPSTIAYVGQSITDQVVMNLNLLNQQLQPEIIQLDSGSTGSLNDQKSTDTGNVTIISGSGINTIDSVVAQSNDVEIFGVKVPLGTIVTPIQMAVRDVFGIQTIVGSMQYDQDRYMVQASSTSGDAWEVQYPPKTIDLTIQDEENNFYQRTVPLVVSAWPTTTLETAILKPLEVLQLDAATFPLSPTLQLMGTSETVASMSAVSATDSLTITIEPTGPTWHTNSVALEVMLNPNIPLVVTAHPSLSDKIDHLADELTFNILRSSDTMNITGITASYPAFQHFQEGLKFLEQFEDLLATEQVPNQAILASAIHHFQRSIHYDSSFALAHYRLGVALQKNGQPTRAVAAFQASLRIDPALNIARNVWAYTLYNFDNNYHPHYIPAPIRFNASAVATQNQYKAQAMDLWMQVLASKEQISPIERASAYYGLCLTTLDIGGERLNSSESNIFTPGQAFNLAYFYCHQAKQSYAQLAPSVRSTEDIQHALSSVYVAWGRSVAEKLGGYVEEVPHWSCEASYIDEHGSRPGSVVSVYPDFAREAMPYYQHAAALHPQNRTLECQVARMAVALGDDTYMKRLNQRPTAHINLGDEYEWLAHLLVFDQKAKQEDREQAVQYYRSALEEYKRAIELDAYSSEALDRYAYTLWKWHLSWQTGRLTTEPDAESKEHAKAMAYRGIEQIIRADARSEHAFAHSTLGEVLFATAKNDDERAQALKHLKVAYDLSLSHRSYDETRWDLAQAYLCSGRGDEALPLLEDIRRNEMSLEYQQFGHNDLLRPVCLIERP